MKQEIKPLSRGKVLRDMEQWLSAELRFADDNETLWTMFKTVVTSSSWGTSEYGGPVWLMDFSLDNLKKLFPDNPWLLAMEEERSKGKYEAIGCTKSSILSSFSLWFELRARKFITKCGLGNVLLKLESSYSGSLSFYCWGTFLVALQKAVKGYLYRPTETTMLDCNFSLKESKIVQRGEFLTYLSNGWVDSEPVMRNSFPDFTPEWDLRWVKKHSKYGECYQAWNFCSAKGYIIPEITQEKFLILLVSDMMEAEARLVQNKDELGLDSKYYFYPPMRYDTYLAEESSSWGHIRFTQNVYITRSVSITVELPKIDAEYGEFWHRQFPLKQHWRTVENFEN